MFCKTLVLTIVIFCTLVNIGYGFSDCGSVVGNVSDVQIENCEDKDATCVLKRGTNVTIKIIFTTTENTPEVKAIVHGVILDVPIPFALPNSDGCKNSGLNCPLAPSNTYTYEATLPILKKYPRVTVDVKWELQNKDEKDIVCIYIPAKLQ